MSTFDVLEQQGALRLAGFLFAVATFLLLHLIRLPFVAIERGLLAAQRGLDRRITTSVTAHARNPFYAAPAAA